MSVKSLGSNGDAVEISDHAALLERVVLHQSRFVWSLYNWLKFWVDTRMNYLFFLILAEDLQDNDKMESNVRRKSLQLSKSGERFIERIDSKVIIALILWYFWSGQWIALEIFFLNVKYRYRSFN